MFGTPLTTPVISGPSLSPSEASMFGRPVSYNYPQGLFGDTATQQPITFGTPAQPKTTRLFDMPMSPFSNTVAQQPIRFGTAPPQSSFGVPLQQAPFNTPVTRQAIPMSSIGATPFKFPPSFNLQDLKDIELGKWRQYVYKSVMDNLHTDIEVNLEEASPSMRKTIASELCERFPGCVFCDSEFRSTEKRCTRAVDQSNPQDSSHYLIKLAV